MTSNRFDPDAAHGSLQEAHLIAGPVGDRIVADVAAGALVDISVSLRKLAGGSDDCG